MINDIKCGKCARDGKLELPRRQVSLGQPIRWATRVDTDNTTHHRDCRLRIITYLHIRVHI
jgi:hypothetical protein